MRELQSEIIGDRRVRLLVGQAGHYSVTVVRRLCQPSAARSMTELEHAKPGADGAPIERFNYPHLCGYGQSANLMDEVVVLLAMSVCPCPSLAIRLTEGALDTPVRLPTLQLV
jgi:hypothetical protein